MKKKIISSLLAVSCTISPVFAAPQESMEEKSLETHYSEVVEHVVEVAYWEIGYLEKSSRNNLYDKTANAGSNNYTKYAEDLGSWNFYGGNLNGYPWCDMFVDWVFCTAFGVSTAKQITYQNPYGSAACVSSAGFYKAAGRFYSQPQPGDQIFFGNHTGLVYKVDGSTVYTIEGNTNPSSGVVANGGAVVAKKYNLNSSRIVGYGRPDYSVVAQTAKTNYDIYAQWFNAELKRQEMREKVFSALSQPFKTIT